MGDGTYPIPRRSDHAPSESVSGVDAIIEGLQDGAWWDGLTQDEVVPLADAEAAVHATVREIETWLRSDPVEVYRVRLADEVARRFGGTPDE